jgi:hypothetical protein
MIETAHSYHHPYKPKQRYSHYIKDSDLSHGCDEIESTCRNSEMDQPTPSTVIHHHCSSQSISNAMETIYQSNGKDMFQTASSSSSSSSIVAGLPVGSSHDLIQTKSLPISTLVKKEPNLEQKQFVDNTNASMASLLKVNGSKTAGALSVHVPCLVCGDEASGFHYGVNSCEGCKVRIDMARYHILYRILYFVCYFFSMNIRAFSVVVSLKECLIVVIILALVK